MGQYYKFIILADTKKNNKECILLVLNPHTYMNGAKLMEHSYKNTTIMNTVEYLISKYSQFYKSSIVWAGDYADDEANTDINLYKMADDYSSYQMTASYNCRYIVNHTKKLYVDKNREIEDDERDIYGIYREENNIHPLPLLISEGNGRGGGDYNGNQSNLCGTWARDVISMEEDIPDGYNELVCEFKEY
jgi:hypothetical protein